MPMYGKSRIDHATGGGSLGIPKRSPPSFPRWLSNKGEHMSQFDMSEPYIVGDDFISSPLFCYECESPVLWLAPDGRCSNCTRCTSDEISDENVQ